MLFLVGFFGKPKLCPCSALFFQHIVILLILTGCHKGESQGVGSSERVVALIGDDVILPCPLEPAVDAVSKSLEWSRPDLKPRFVHVWHDDQNLLENQNPSYKGRTSVSTEKLKRGDLSLSLSAVKPSDNGIYRCYFPSQNKDFSVELVAGSFSPPVISRVSKDSNGVVLQCEAKGWYPEPEVLWQDDKGKVLTAGPKEMDKGPDDLFTVRIKMTLQKSNDEIFTCRVHQRTINQTRETHIQISADFFETSSSAAYISIIVVILLGVVVAAAFIFRKWRQVKAKEHLHQDDAERREIKQLTADLVRKNRTPEEELQKTLKEMRSLEEKFAKTLKEKRARDEEFEKTLKEKRARDEEFEKTLKEKRTREEEFEKTLKETLKEKEKLEEEFEKTLKETLKEKEKLEEEFEKTLKEKEKLEEELQKELVEKKRALEEELQKKNEEEKNLKQMVPKLMEFSKELHEQTDKLQQQKGDMERSIDDIEDKLKSAEKTAERDRARGFLDMKTSAITAKKHLERRTQEDDQLNTKTCLLQNRSDELLGMMTDRQRAAESDRKTICDQLEKVQRKLSENKQKT